jgi:Mannosylglycerate hydrolase MGH1-like glycoside hydrolase domain
MTTAPSPGTTAEHDRLNQATEWAEDSLAEANPWYEWVPTCRSGPGAPCGRTTATAGMPGVSFHMIMHGPGPIGGTRTAWQVCGHWPRAVPGLGALERRRPDPQGTHVWPHRSAGESRRGRQRLLVVPRWAAQPRLAALAISPAAPTRPGRNIAGWAVVWQLFRRCHGRSEAGSGRVLSALAPDDIGTEEMRVLRQACAGLVWSKQMYPYRVAQWLEGDPGQPPPPPGHRFGRNSGWRHFDSFDVLAMPDPWEYPWFAAWDLAFHAVSWAHLDPAFAKYQLLVLLREWYLHPNGALPAYEWSFDDVNPPVHALAALRVFVIGGATDLEFLERVFQKLLLNFTWWLNRQDPEGNNIFGGGFLGLDNISPIDRSHLPAGARLDQADGTAWMAYYSVAMLTMAAILAQRDSVYEDRVVKFLEQLVLVMDALEESCCYDPDDGFFYDLLTDAFGNRAPVNVQTLVGVIPTLPAITLPTRNTERLQRLRKRFARKLEAENRQILDWRIRGTGNSRRALVSIVSRTNLGGSSRHCSTRMRSYRPTVCALYRNVTPRLIRFPACRVQPSNMSPRNPAPQCTAGIPTGADRCGSRSTIWSFARSCNMTISLGPNSRSNIRRDLANIWPWATSPVIWLTGWSASGFPAQMADGRSTEASSSSRPTRPGKTTSCSTSTSMETTAQESEPCTKPAGLPWWLTCCSTHLVTCIGGFSTTRRRQHLTCPRSLRAQPARTINRGAAACLQI